MAGGYSNKVFTYASGGFFGPKVSPETLRDQAAQWVESGFGGAKIKGAAGSVQEDVERVEAVRDAIGPERPLMIDTMFRPSVPHAIRLARALAPFNLHFLEAPTAIDNPAGWAYVRKQGRVPLAGPELIPDLPTMRPFIDDDAVDFFQFDVTLAGGGTVGLDAASFAAIYHRQVTLHCAGSAIAVAASAHLGAAIHNCDSIEFHVIHRGLHDRLWDSGWSLKDGWLHIPDQPGLGLPFDFEWILANAAA